MIDGLARMSVPWRGMRFAGVLVAVMAVCLASASASLATEPTGDFKVFKQCPRFNKEVHLNEISCIYNTVESGEVKIGSVAVPIVNHIILQGGVITNNETEAQRFTAALNGETLSKTPQKVPGGLLDFVRCNEISNFLERIACEVVFENGVTGVNAVTELAKPASSIGVNTNNLINGEGVALSLPLKVKLENPFLGGECYVGTSSHPVTLNLTSGTTSPPPPNKPISGKVGNLQFKDEFEFIEIKENTLVDNSFSAPEATGCGGIFSFLIDPIVDSKLGLPSAAGKNTTVQNNLIKKATASAVIASE